jgi:hypothetical protein
MNIVCGCFGRLGGGGRGCCGWSPFCFDGPERLPGSSSAGRLMPATGRGGGGPGGGLGRGSCKSGGIDDDEGTEVRVLPDCFLPSFLRSLGATRSLGIS